jgi:hypothetical protein
MDPWFLQQLQEIANCQWSMVNCPLDSPELAGLVLAASEADGFCG